ncbi:Maf family protein [Pelagibacterales bacterium SAG-MED11]|nr:Maf family protein [Pelagibacterales bacterium SAG-MED11]
MSDINEVIRNKKTNINPIWIMRQAGRYLPEFRNIRKKNTNFIKLCLNYKLSAEITLQPLKRFDLDAAIIFSDILMVPYGLNQKVEFRKNFGPILGELNLQEILNFNEKDFTQKLKPVYMALDLVKKNDLTQNKSTIGFVGAPWTLLVYLINRKSPKQKLISNFFQDSLSIEKILSVLDKFLKIHIKNQIANGADSVIDLDGELISKPQNREEALNILKKLNGKKHNLVSSVCISKNGSMIWNHTDKATLTMKKFSDKELREYLSKISDESLYAYNVYQIEGEGKNLFLKIDGDKNTIMGLPIEKIQEYLNNHI